MFIYLIRHGETFANVAKEFAGITDVALTENGKEQAKEAMSKLSNVAFDHVYSSDLIRAHHTALKICEAQSIQPMPLKELREMNFGIWEGKTFKEIQKSDPERLNSWFVDFENFKVPEGESVKEMFERVTNAYKKIIEPHSLDSDTKIAIVAHGGVIQALLSYLCYENESGYWKFKIDNCGINKIEYVMGYPVIQGINL